MKVFSPWLRAQLLFGLSACTVHSDAPVKPAPTSDVRPLEPRAESSAPGARPPQCELPPVQGRCRAMHRSFYFDPQLGACRYFVYGGCDGNENRFDTPSECLTTCTTAPSVSAVACKVGNAYYPDKSRVVLEAGGGTCTCKAGHLSECSAPLPCAEGTVLGTSCAEPGTADGCLIVETACLPACKADADCADSDYPQCREGHCAAGVP